MGDTVNESVTLTRAQILEIARKAKQKTHEQVERERREAAVMRRCQPDDAHVTYLFKQYGNSQGTALEKRILALIRLCDQQWRITDEERGAMLASDQRDRAAAESGVFLILI